MADPQHQIHLGLERRAAGEIARVTIDREHKLNALDSRLLGELASALTDLARLETVRAVVLTGSGSRAFIGGADIGELATLDAANARAFITGVHAVCEAIRTLPVPVIARIQGFTFGAGLEIAAACDLRIAAGTASFGMPEVRLGLPSVVEAALLPTLIGWGRTRRLLYLGETIAAPEALSWGLIERLVPAEQLDDAVEEWLGLLLLAAPGAIRGQKALMRRWEDLSLKDAIAAGITAFELAYRTDEPRRATEAFLEAQAARKRTEN